MFYLNENYHVIRTSNNIFYQFHIDKHKKIIVEKYKNNILQSSIPLEKHVVTYSLDIDENNIIHFIYMDTDGTLKYTSYSINNLDNNHNHTDIFYMNTKNFNLYFLKLKILSNKPHVFYATKMKLKKTKFSIYHSYIKNTKWTNNILDYIETKSLPKPYIIDTYKHNIYIFYSPNNSSNYCIKQFSPDNNIWKPIDNNICIDDFNNLRFLITKTGVAYICYNSSKNKNLQLFIRYKDLTKSNSVWSKDILVSNNDDNAFYPSLISQDNSISVFWYNGSSIIYKNSDEKNHTFSNNKSLNFEKGNIINLTYLSNHSEDINIRSTSVFTNCCSQPFIPAYSQTKSITNSTKNLTTNLNTTSKKDNIKNNIPSNQENTFSKSCIKEKKNTIIHNDKNKSITKQNNKNIINSTNKNISSNNMNKQLTYKNINNKNKKIDDKSTNINDLNNKTNGKKIYTNESNYNITDKVLYIKKLEKTIQTLNNSIKNLNEENSDLQKKISTLTEQIEESKCNINILNKQLNMTLKKYTYLLDLYDYEINYLNYLKKSCESPLK
ncbi:hypothetical protein ACFIJ5_04730 [Haloimpatiens sp. FM7330]|uniref:hypothetical protein n=1 Tax=Haloimpatiens sp. FM7330 TaxID=3298610 RepID=UPI003645D11E